MSTARLIPETWNLTGDDAWKTLKTGGRRRLLVDAFTRLRFSDGFSHARSLAFMLALASIQGMIALVGLAVALGGHGISDVIVRAVNGAAPGPVGDLLTTAISQAQKEGATHSYTGLAFGGIGWLITSTTAMGQLERGLNRLYGVETDRPSVQKYGRAFLLAISVGFLLALSITLLAFGRALGASLKVGPIGIWDFLTWPVGLGLTLVSMALLFRLSPRRRMPAWSWLAFGSSVAVALWFVFTSALSFYFGHSGSFGKTYGPLAGVVALLFWALLSSIAMFYGAAVAAQLEGVRSDARSTPQDERKVEESEPDAAPSRTADAQATGTRA